MVQYEQLLFKKMCAVYVQFYSLTSSAYEFKYLSKKSVQSNQGQLVSYYTVIIHYKYLYIIQSESLSKKQHLNDGKTEYKLKLQN